jgi:hypothetical protein
MKTSKNKLVYAMMVISKITGIENRILYYNFIKTLPYSKQKILYTLNEKNTFFLVSTGRTGTTLFANMLNSIGNYYIEHEPVPNEQYFHRRCLEDPLFSYKYINEFRLKEIYFRIKRKSVERYGEVNGALRRNIKDIKNLLGNCSVVQIVRDGRNVVSSVLNRRTFTENDKSYYNMIPDDTVVSKKEWKSFDRFQKIAFMWSAENAYMRKNCDFTVKFEDLIQCYELAQEKLFKPLEIPVDYETWSNFIGQKMNARKDNDDKYKYENWADYQKDFFDKICGNEMRYYGYYE